MSSTIWSRRPIRRSSTYGRSSTVPISTVCETVITGTWSENQLIEEQIAYYQARAAEYEDWWARRGRYDAGPEFLALWRREIRMVEAWLDANDVSGHVLEIAAGTGTWSQWLEVRADQLTVLDAAPEMLKLCRQRLVRPTTAAVIADIFTWESSKTYDVLFSAFWLWHIPEDRWAAFWEKMGRLVAPGGLFLAIETLDPLHASPDAPAEFTTLGQLDVVGESDSIRLRHLDDGRKFRVIKRYRSSTQLVESLRHLGWDVEVYQTEFAFVCVAGRRRD